MVVDRLYIVDGAAEVPIKRIDMYATVAAYENGRVWDDLFDEQQRKRALQTCGDTTVAQVFEASLGTLFPELKCPTKGTVFRRIDQKNSEQDWMIILRADSSGNVNVIGAANRDRKATSMRSRCLWYRLLTTNFCRPGAR